MNTENKYRILCLDGGGAKGFYTLGVLNEIEKMIGRPLHEKFDLIFGTSTGSIIASLIALGYGIDDIHDLYKQHVPTVMKPKKKSQKTAALNKLATEIFGNKKFDDVKTSLGVVATQWMTERPMIFKNNVNQAHGRVATFKPGFGVLLADAVQASCSAYPFFEKKTVVTDAGNQIELIDGGYCANNPTLYAIADAVSALNKEHAQLRVISIGVGIYPEPKPSFFMKCAKKYLLSVQLLQKTLEINTQSMDQLRSVLFKQVPTIRVSETYSTPEMATDLMEHDLAKLNILYQRGGDSFAKHEGNIKKFLL
ncbi:patatin-like phospholipase family protein [Erwinia sorbitola]|uniref:patatin-like phospholipase family protein n=1 Tax=Erwinia sorbitola TaxID=2681984 RepID=UPI0012B714E9|nr:patatin-like phospholipase family protein [Erwinia sorbitola]